MLIPIIWIPGIALYGAPVVAWLFQHAQDIHPLHDRRVVIAVIVVMAAARWGSSAWPSNKGGGPLSGASEPAGPIPQHR